MSGKLNYRSILFPVILLIILSNSCFSQETGTNIDDSQYADTTILSESVLEDVRFYLTEDVSKIENTVRDTLLLHIDGKIYKLPYRVTSTASVVIKGNNRYFRLTGLPLIQEVELQNYLSELFKNPREIKRCHTGKSMEE
ncbi:MAG: hypothetical protein IPL53_19160 [Ignavibacteria bacterium]|nr:hypothetical protein [Ignavibacteria bacterium]